ncbi:hypothetical protein M514_24769 [Trichuris suis]|uniref:Uncharacterized protein n=1 Tax=Trichuris suis TaxID=68888 RepID=A0A085N0U3_9BILA|nr:hypothetical protein M514_24769 [Trichuris suis]
MQIRRPPESTLDSLNDSLFDISRKELHFQFGSFSEPEDKSMTTQISLALFFHTLWD